MCVTGRHSVDDIDSQLLFRVSLTGIDVRQGMNIGKHAGISVAILFGALGLILVASILASALYNNAVGIARRRLRKNRLDVGNYKS